MSLTNMPRGYASMGVPLVGRPMSQGKTFFVEAALGNDGRDGRSLDSAFKTLTQAKSKLVANKNDTVYYVAGSGSITLSATFDWNLDYTHLIGECSPIPVAQRARIFQLSTATGISPLFKVSASGCYFENIYVFHGVDDATSKICFSVSGQRNTFVNCHFAGIGHATMDVAGAASLQLDGADECYFKHCSIGLDTISRGANSTELLFKSGTNCTRNLFEDCIIYGYISNAGHRLVTIGDGTAIDRWNIFRRCLFITDSVNRGVTATEVFSTPAGLVQGKIILDQCSLLTDGASGSGVWDASGVATIWANMPAPAAAAAGGIMTKL